MLRVTLAHRLRVSCGNCQLVCLSVGMQVQLTGVVVIATVAYTCAVSKNVFDNSMLETSVRSLQGQGQTSLKRSQVQ